MASVADVLPAAEPHAVQAEVIEGEGISSAQPFGAAVGNHSHPWECTDRIRQLPAFSRLDPRRWARQPLALARLVGEWTPAAWRRALDRLGSSGRLRLAAVAVLVSALMVAAAALAGLGATPAGNVAPELRGADRVLVGENLQLQYRRSEGALVISRTPPVSEPER